MSRPSEESVGIPSADADPVELPCAEDSFSSAGSVPLAGSVVSVDPDRSVPVGESGLSGGSEPTQPVWRAIDASNERRETVRRPVIASQKSVSPSSRMSSLAPCYRRHSSLSSMGAISTNRSSGRPGCSVIPDSDLGVAGARVSSDGR